MNKLMLLGRLTNDIELSTGETLVGRFTLAVNRSYKKEGQPDADFIPMVVFGKRAETMQKFLGKGRQILVEAEVRNNNYEKDGKTVYGFQFIVQNFEFADSSKKSDNTQAPETGDTFVPASDEDELPFN